MSKRTIIAASLSALLALGGTAAVVSAQDAEPADDPAPNTVTGTIEMVDEDGQTRYQLRVGDQLLDLSFGLLLALLFAFACSGKLLCLDKPIDVPKNPLLVEAIDFFLRELFELFKKFNLKQSNEFGIVFPFKLIDQKGT